MSMKKRDGFANQIMILIPPDIINKTFELTRELYITDIGYFPKAEEHYVDRKSGNQSYIIILCIGGSGWCKIGNTHNEIRENEAIIIEKGVPHIYGSGDAGWWRIFWIHFTGIKAHLFAKTISDNNLNCSFPLKMGSESRQLFSLMCSSLLDGIDLISYELTCNRLWHLLGSISRDRRTGTSEVHRTISSCLRLIEKRISTSLTLDELAKEAGLTPQYLCRIFKQYTNHSPLEYYNLKKIQRASILLDMTSEQINEISQEIGINDPYYFTRIFKKYMGMSPTEYRNRVM